MRKSSSLLFLWHFYFLCKSLPIHCRGSFGVHIRGSLKRNPLHHCLANGGCCSLPLFTRMSSRTLVLMATRSYIFINFTLFCWTYNLQFIFLVLKASFEWILSPFTVFQSHLSFSRARMFFSHFLFLFFFFPFLVGCGEKRC